MNLTESYINRIKYLSGILSEQNKLNNYEYQIRHIGGDVFYKRKKGDKIWDFTDELDFYKNSNKNNILKWEDSNKKEKKPTHNLDYTKNPLEVYKVYFENVCPPDFKVEISDDFIKISKK